MTSSENLFCRGPVTRRCCLEIGAAAVAGLSLPQMLKAREQSGQGQSDPSVIFVWLPGGPPHMEMYDLKPDAPSDYRGEFRPIKTNVPGIDICELFPQQAKVADKFALIRSVHHTFADHGGGHKRFLTGRDPAEPTGFVNDKPCVGSMASKALTGRRDLQGLPNYIALGGGRVNSVDTYSFGSAYLGPQTHPFRIAADPSDGDFSVKKIGIDRNERVPLDDRLALLNSFEQVRRTVEENESAATMNVFNQRAKEMLTSARVREAFDIAQEPRAVRDRFGRHGWGQRALLARRLVERGVPWVTVVMENPYQSGVTFPEFGTYNWDSHAVNCHIFKDALTRFPIYDRTISAMIEDLYARGLDQRVLLVVTGEFGRTPRLSANTGTKTKITQPGRDHWPRAMSMLVSGGGLQMGQVVGATNRKGEEPAERPLSPNDLWATVFRHLGVDYTDSFLDHSGRPMPMLPHGEPIAELI